MTRDKGKNKWKKEGGHHIFNNERKQGLVTSKQEFAADFRHDLRRKFFQLEQV